MDIFIYFYEPQVYLSDMDPWRAWITGFSPGLLLRVKSNEYTAEITYQRAAPPTKTNISLTL